MNELIDDDCGLPVDVEDTTPMGWARRAKFSQEALEATLERAIGLSNALRRAALAALKWYQWNDIEFRQRLGLFAELSNIPAPSSLQSRPGEMNTPLMPCQ